MKNAPIKPSSRKLCKLKNMKIFFVFIINISLAIHNLYSQTGVFDSKSIIVDSVIGLVSLDYNSNITLFRDGKMPLITSNTNANGSNIYKKNPICWDIVDSFLYQINLHDDGPGMTYSDLVYYNLNNIINADKKDIEKYINYEADITTISRKLPLYNYMLRIRYREDTLRGPIFFDFQARKDSINMYIYIHDSRTIEIWRYAELHLLKRNLTYQQRISLIPSEPWVRTASIPANITDPFRIVHTHGQDYLITTEGDIYHIEKNSLKPAGKLPTLPGKGILVIDKGKDAVYFMEEKWMEEAQKRPLEEIISKEAVRILKEK